MHFEVNVTSGVTLKAVRWTGTKLSDCIKSGKVVLSAKGAVISAIFFGDDSSMMWTWDVFQISHRFMLGINAQPQLVNESPKTRCQTRETYPSEKTIRVYQLVPWVFSSRADVIPTFHRKMTSRRPIDIGSFTKQQFTEWFESFDVVLCDCDGTINTNLMSLKLFLSIFVVGVLWQHDRPFEGASDVVNQLGKLGKKVYLITNNSMTSAAQMVEKCTKMNYDLGEASMICVSNVLARYLVKSGFNKKAYVIGSQALKAELEKVGISVVGYGPDVMVHALPEFVQKELPNMDREVGAVVVGFDEHFCFPKLFKAVNYLRNPAVQFIATNEDEKFDFPQFTFPDAGPIIAAITNVTGRKPIVAGKPSKIIADIGLPHESHRDSRRFLMIGDRMNTDILFGTNNNFQTLLVTETGNHSMKHVQENLDKIDGGDESLEKMIPDYHISALANLLKHA